MGLRVFIVLSSLALYIQAFAQSGRGLTYKLYQGTCHSPNVIRKAP